MKKQFQLINLVVILIISYPVLGQANNERQWPSYRGNHSSGVLDNANLPDSFNLQSMMNIRWKSEVPGLGLSSPVIWDGTVL
jgi:hypothetical protein